MVPEHRDWIPTRHSLLSRLKDWDDQEGWREFFHTYWRLIYGVALGAGLTEAEAQDVVQETILAVAKKMPSFKYDPALGSFKAWLLHTTRWKIIAQFRQRRRHSPEVSLHPDNNNSNDAFEGALDPPAFEWQQIWDAEWESNLLANALDKVKQQVSPGQFQIFYLHVLKQQSVQQTAAALGVNAAQVYLAKHRVQRVLKREIARAKRLESALEWPGAPLHDL